MADPPPRLDPNIIALKYRLPHLTESLRRQRKIKIVAIGSSSTAGADNVLPFPYRLQFALRTRFYGRAIDILNRGVGGQEAPEELSRFECDVIAEAPTLVIWQIGTNAVYHKVDYDFGDVQNAMTVGLAWLATLQSDVILMDAQYTQAMVDKNAETKAQGYIGLEGTNVGVADDIELRIATVAERARVNVFRRWQLMKDWNASGIGMEKLDDGQHLHTGDWATQWITNALDSAIGAAVGSVPGVRRQPYDP